MIPKIDYGTGKIFSVKTDLHYLGFEYKLTDKKEDIEKADAIILPGVGAFPWAMNMLGLSGLIDTIKEQAKIKPFLGICLGMQLLFEKSYEFEECKGLGLIGGYVDKINEPDLVIPHMGWNKLVYNHDCPLFDGLGDDEYVYFVHSYRLSAIIKICMPTANTAQKSLRWYRTEDISSAVSSTLRRVEKPVLKYLKTLRKCHRR